MIIESILLLVVAVVAAAFLAKVYEWRQDVLYGPYIERWD